WLPAHTRKAKPTFALSRGVSPLPPSRSIAGQDYEPPALGWRAHYHGNARGGSIWLPKLRSSVSSMTRSRLSPAGTKVSTISKSNWRLTARGDQRARLRTWWKLLQLPAISLPVERRAAATVRRPWASRVPVSKVINFLQVGAVNNGRNVIRTSIPGLG